MTEEYKLRADAYGKLLRQSILRGAVYWLAAASVLRWFMKAEPATWTESGPIITIVLFAVVLAGIYSAAFNYQRGKSFRLLVSDEKMEFKSLQMVTELLFTDIVRVTRTKENVLLVYTHHQPRKAIAAIPDTLTDRSKLDAQIQNHTTITDEPKLPHAFSVYFIAARSFFLTVLALHFFLSNVPTTVIYTGIILLAVVAYYFREVFLFRHYRRSTRGIITLGIFSLLILTRIILFMSSYR